jgi:integrase
LLIINNKRCRLRTHASGKNTTTFEIRFRRDGYDISASGTTIELAKANFIEKLKTAKPKTKSDGKPVVCTTFNSFAMYYFENFRKERVAEKTYRTDLNRYNRYLKPYFKETPINKITPSTCKTLLDKVKEQGKGKTADELYSLMNGIFNAAITHRLIEFNPLSTVLHIQHDREEGKALAPDDEQKLLLWLSSSSCDCVVEISLLLFCGLRANEMENEKNPPQICDRFIKAVNSKRHFKDKSKIEYKFIPICTRLKHFIGDNVTVRHSARAVRKRLQVVLPDYTLKDLRTTFYTKCQMFGVAEPALKEFMGHSFGKLGNAYSDLTKYGDYLVKEGAKLNQW